VSALDADTLARSLIVSLSVLTAIGVGWRDLRRRRIEPSRIHKVNFLTVLDIAAPAIAAGFAVSFAGAAALNYAASGSGIGPARAFALDAVAGGAISVYLWIEGRRQLQFQRPDGIVLGEFLVLAGIFELVAPIVTSETWNGIAGRKPFWAGWIVAGGALIALIVPRFLRRREEHRIIERVAQQGQSVQAEYTPPTPECPHPERWRMLDSMTAEVEVLDFLKSLVMTLKPELVVETGTFMGLSAIKMAEGMKANGFGRIITCEFDPVVFQKARERIQESGLANWIECRNESSLDMNIAGTIDIFFSDSDINIRENEIRKFLPQISPNGLVLTHDASSHYKVVRQAALRLEEEGLLSVVLVPTPRGLVIAQKRAGRK